MKKLWMFMGLFAVALVGWGCDGQPMCGGDDLGNGETNCDLDPGEGGSGGGGGFGDQYWDGDVCRSRGDFHALGCAQTYDLALVTERCGGATPACGGTCGGWLVVQDSCTPSLGCTYDPASRALVGVVFGDDVPSNCGGASHSVTYGDGYHGCQFTDLLLDRQCWLKGAP